MHITVSVVVIMFELTGALTYILPTMIVVGITKSVSTLILPFLYSYSPTSSSNLGGKGGIADRMIWFNGFPYLDTKDEHVFHVPVSHVMIEELTMLPANEGIEVKELEAVLAKNRFGGFPIVRDRVGKVLMGWIGRTELIYGMEKAKRERGVSSASLGAGGMSSSGGGHGAGAADLGSLHLPGGTKCYFNPPPEGLEGIGTTSTLTTFNPGESGSHGKVEIDFSRFIDPTPLTVHPSLPLETVMEIFKKIGPRVILVEHRGKLMGCVTIKDCLAYQAKVEKRSEYSSINNRAGNRSSENGGFFWGGGGGAGARGGRRGRDEEEEAGERLWEWIVWTVGWVRWKLRLEEGPPSDAGSEIILFSDEEDDEEAEEVESGEDGDREGTGAWRGAGAGAPRGARETGGGVGGTRGVELRTVR